MNRKVWTSLLIIGMAFAAIAGGTLAWFTAEAKIGPNVFTAGTVEIEADETFDLEDTRIDNWNPGDCIEKKVWVKITGTKRAYLRMKYNDGWYENKGTEEEPDWVGWIPNNPPDVDPIVIKLDGNLFPDDVDHWVKVSDWYYYVGIGDPDTTIDVISQVCLDGRKADDQFQGKQYRLGFNFEAIQVTHEAVFNVWRVALVAGSWHVVDEVDGVWTCVIDTDIYEWDPADEEWNLVEEE
jgi:predicted ribosomally synthesized peptide with SipW-like signal peptide